jgi:hypothetical protein
LFAPRLWEGTGASPHVLRQALRERLPVAPGSWERHLADDLLDQIVAWFAALLAEAPPEDEDQEQNGEDEGVDLTVPRVALDWLARLSAVQAAGPEAANAAAAAYKGPPGAQRYASMLALLRGGARKPHKDDAPKQQQQQQQQQQQPQPKDEWSVGSAAWRALPPEAREALKAARPKRK